MTLPAIYKRLAGERATAAVPPPPAKTAKTKKKLRKAMKVASPYARSEALAKIAAGKPKKETRPLMTKESRRESDDFVAKLTFDDGSTTTCRNRYGVATAVADRAAYGVGLVDIRRLSKR